MPTLLSRGRGVWLALCLAALCLVGPAHAQDPAPEARESTFASAGKDAEVRFLYPAGPVYKQDKVFPLILELHNPSAIPKTYKTSWTQNQPLPQALESVLLQPGERRRFPLDFPRNEVGSISTVEVNGKTYPTELQPAARAISTALLSPADEPFAYLRTLKLEADPNAASNPEQATPAELVPLASLSLLSPELVPEGWPMLSCLDVIIAHQLSTMSLSKAQEQALLSWVGQGGRLVLVSDGSVDEFRGTAFEPHLPLQPSSVASDGGLLQLEGKPSAGARTLMTYRNRPLLVEKPYLRGNLFLVTAPLKDLGPLTVAEGETLWRQVQPQPSSDPSATNYNSYPYNSNYYPSLTSNTLKNIPELPRASAGWVALFLLGYALIVGPVNLGFLRRKDKMLWSFVTVPVIAVVFAGAAYLLNFSTRSRVPVLRELGVLQVRSGDSQGFAQSEALFSSPAAGRYSVECSPEAILHPSSYNYQADPPFGLYTSLGGGSLQANLRMGTWDILMLAGQAIIAVPKLSGSWKNGSLSVETTFATEAGEAMVYNLEQGASPTFALKGGAQTEKLELSNPGGYNKFDPLGQSADPDAHPGRADLATALGSQSSAVFEMGKTYLLFWTSELKSPITPKAPAVHRSEYLVIVELDS